MTDPKARHLDRFFKGETNLGGVFSYEVLHNQMVWGILDQRMPGEMYELTEDCPWGSKGEIGFIETWR
jgi:hypothetical protein